MSGSLKRALGLWVQEQMHGTLHVYADDQANTGYEYPACTVAEVGHGIVPVGCGRRDYRVLNPETGRVVAAGRLHREETTFRLTVSAPGTKMRPGQETVDELLAHMEEMVLLRACSEVKALLLDSEAVPPRYFPVEFVKPTDRQPVPPDTTGEPFLYRGALSLRVARLVPVEREVEHVMVHIHVEDK